MSATLHDNGARATLLALHAFVAGAARPLESHYIVLPSRAPLPEADVLEILGKSAKPLGCIALVFKGVMVIGLWPYPTRLCRARATRSQGRRSASGFPARA
jgi:hypothetical protein